MIYYAMVSLVPLLLLLVGALGLLLHDEKPECKAMEGRGAWGV